MYRHPAKTNSPEGMLQNLTNYIVRYCEETQLLVVVARMDDAKLNTNN